MTKLCTKCKTSLPLSGFHRRSASKDGLCLICKTCAIAHSKEWAKQNKERTKNYLKTWTSSERAKELIRKSRIKRRVKLNAGGAKWERLNPEKRKEICGRYYQRNKRQILAIVRNRQCALINRFPSWVNPNDIKQIYINCPQGMEVDHIIPLKGKNVSGLHVPGNLQYLSRSENRRKHNKVSLVP